MTTPLNLYLCLEDSPNFRKELSESENSIFGLETTIKSLVKLTRASVELASEYTAKQLQFAEELGNFAKRQPDSLIKTILSKYANSIQEVERSRKILQSHMYSMFIEPLEAFAKNGIIPLKEMKKVAEKASYDADSALAKYMSKRPRDTGISEASLEVSETRKEFHNRYLDYVIKINELEAKKKFEFMEYILAIMFTESSFYHQSYEILKDMEPHMKDVTRLLHEARAKFNDDIQESQHSKNSIIEKAKETYNPLYSYKKSPEDVTLGVNSSIAKSGYLFIKGNQRVMQTWTRRYFFILDGQLNYIDRGGRISKDDDEMESITLRLCHIKPVNSTDRRFCFEVISPNRTYVLQAENQEEMRDWIYCLQTTAQDAIYSHQSTMFNANSSDQFQDVSRDELVNNHDRINNESLNRTEKSMSRIKNLPGNDICADCKSKDPRWASTNFGTLLCIECSGIHRSLGVHVSKVRSLMLDKWEPESLGVMLKLGNSKTSSIYEAKLAGNNEIIMKNPSWERSEKEKFIIDKYVRKMFIVSEEDESNDTVDLGFWKAICESDLYEALRYLSLGANVDWKNKEINSTTALHQAILRNDNVSVEFLLQWLCNINEADNDGWSGLHHAAATNNSRLLLTLMKRHADINLKDKNGKIPVDIAVELQHVQAVTALRLFNFENELTRTQYSTFGVDEALTSINKPPYISHSTTSSIDLRFPVTTKITNNNDQDKSIPTSLSSSPITKSGLLNMDDAELISKSIIGYEFFNNIQETGVNFGISNLVTSKFSLASLKLPNFGNIQKENETEEENK
ncbi:ArfGap-domain-containing protein [Rhizophagus irregularis]|uniref:ArfGap-domain-containing protein n=1 Tax=Rhizophagus irregularis TaxID=588596 RepID=A0A2I1GR75_9GLOM|nr:ArfGap-domain-containing protein [Rhizophagus irregularis]